PFGGFDRSNRPAVYRHQIVLTEKDIQFAKFQSLMGPSQFDLVEDNEIVARVFLDLRPLMFTAAVFDREAMKAKLLSQFNEILTRGIAHVSPDYLGLFAAKFADVGNITVFAKLV